MKSPWSSVVLRVDSLIGFLLGLVARLWLATLRVRVEVDASLPKDRPWVLSFFHGTQFPLLAWKRRGTTAVMVSLSKDGALQARVLAVLGMLVVRGSSSREGARGLAALVRAVKKGADAAFAVDGPRGPYGVPKPGAAFVAARTGAVLVPMGSAMTRGKVLDRAWDRFQLPWPFTRVAVVLGPLTTPENLGEAIAGANVRAAGLLAGSRLEMVPSRSI